MLDELTYTLGEKKKTCLDVWFKTIPPLVLEGCYFFYLVFNRLSVLRMLDRRNELERLFTVIVFPVSQSGSVPTVRRKPSADLFHLSLSLLPAATGPVVRAQGCRTDYCDYLSLSLWTGNNNNTDHKYFTKINCPLAFFIEARDL